MGRNVVAARVLPDVAAEQPDRKGRAVFGAALVAQPFCLLAPCGGWRAHCKAQGTTPCIVLAMRVGNKNRASVSAQTLYATLVPTLRPAVEMHSRAASTRQPAGIVRGSQRESRVLGGSMLVSRPPPRGTRSLEAASSRDQPPFLTSFARARLLTEATPHSHSAKARLSTPSRSGHLLLWDFLDLHLG